MNDDIGADGSLAGHMLALEGFPLNRSLTDLLQQLRHLGNRVVVFQGFTNDFGPERRKCSAMICSNCMVCPCISPHSAVLLVVETGGGHVRQSQKVRGL